jgi:hypothetical protein
MATAVKHNVYDELDLAKLDAIVTGAGAPVDQAEAVSRLSRLTVLRSGFPRHHASLA